MTTPVIDKFGVVATSGGGAELLDGTASIYVKSVRVSDLSPSRPVITDATATLASGNILISQVDGLAAALAGTISNPLISDLAGNGFALTNFKYLGLANNPGLGDVLVNNSFFVAANIPRFRASTGQAFDVITSDGGDARFYKGATIGVGPVGSPSLFNLPRNLPVDFGTVDNYLKLNAGNGDMVWERAPNQGLSTTDSPAFVDATITGALLSPDTLTTLTITDTGVRAFADSQVLASFRRDGSELVSYDQENTITAFSTSSGNSEIVLSHDTGTLAERSIFTLDSAGLVAEFAGTVRLLINDEISIQDAAGVERLFTSGNYTSLRAGTGADDRFDIDGTGAYIAVQGSAVFWAQAAGNSTRIWCPSTTNFLHIDGTGVNINGAYYFPPVDGTAGQRMITNGAGSLSFTDDNKISAPDGNATMICGDGGINVISNQTTGFSVFSSSVPADTTGIYSPLNGQFVAVHDVSALEISSNGDIAMTCPGNWQMNSYYLPTTIGTAGQVLTADGVSVASWQTLPRDGIFSQTGTATVANTAAQTSIIQLAGAAGSPILPASVSPGYAFSWRFGGVFRTTAPNQTIRWRMSSAAGGVFLDSGILTLPNVNSARAWQGEFYSVWNGSQMVSNFRMEFTTGNSAQEGFHTQAFTVLLAPIFNSALNITVQWGAANANNTIATNWGVLKREY